MDSYLGSTAHRTPGCGATSRALLRGGRRRATACRRPRACARFDGPALVVWAADDKFFPREHGRRLAELLPQGRFELVERSRTFIPEDNPGRLVELLRGFLFS